MRFRRKPQQSQSEPASQSQPEEEFTISVSGGGSIDWSHAIQEAIKGMGMSAALEPPPVPAFPHEKRDEPIRALKAAYLIVRPDGIAFSPLNCSDGSRWYGPQAVAQCFCAGTISSLAASGGYFPGSLFGGLSFGEPHPHPGRDTSCGFYAWKLDAPFPWSAGTWLLEVDLYGRVVEHEQGYRAQKQRVLSISPVPGVLCDEPARLVADMKTGRITAECDACPPFRRHPLTLDRLRRLLNVEVDMGRAWKMREQ
jgi:hypothetical protein